MIRIEKIEDAGIIEDHLRKNTGLNLYQIGDLDRFFWPYTEWYSLYRDGNPSQIILIYKGTELPVMLALCDGDAEDMKTLLRGIKNELPKRFYSHLTKGLNKEIEDSFTGVKHGNYQKMLLERGDFVFDREKITLNKGEEIRRMTAEDEGMIKKFYEESYPDNWFDNRMLLTGKYFGYIISGELKGISGIHVYSSKYRIAVLGNITTHPDMRGRSVCRKVTSVLCDDLFESADVIGLNVHVDNLAAIKSYEAIGFRKTDEYQEYMFERRS